MVPPPVTLADMLARLGDVPAERIRWNPLPGSATEEDVIHAWSGVNRRLCELVEGMLVEKPTGTREGLSAGLLVHHIWNFLEANPIGIALGADGFIRLKVGLVRIPDVCFISNFRLPDGKLPEEAIAGVVPDLAAEILSPSNTVREIQGKIKEYFAAEVRLVWIIDHRKRTPEVYRSPEAHRVLTDKDVLEGDDVLPGFALALQTFFDGRPK